MPWSTHPLSAVTDGLHRRHAHPPLDLEDRGALGAAPDQVRAVRAGGQVHVRQARRPVRERPGRRGRARSRPVGRSTAAARSPASRTSSTGIPSASARRGTLPNPSSTAITSASAACARPDDAVEVHDLAAVLDVELHHAEVDGRRGRREASGRASAAPIKAIARSGDHLRTDTRPVRVVERPVRGDASCRGAVGRGQRHARPDGRSAGRYPIASAFPRNQPRSVEVSSPSARPSASETASPAAGTCERSGSSIPVRSAIDPLVALATERVAADERLGVQVDRPAEARLERRRGLAHVQAVQRVLLLHAGAPQRAETARASRPRRSACPTCGARSRAGSTARIRALPSSRCARAASARPPPSSTRTGSTGDRRSRDPRA